MTLNPYLYIALWFLLIFVFVRILIYLVDHWEL